MTLATQTAIAIARLTRMIEEPQTRAIGGIAATFLWPPKRADIQLILDVVRAQQAEIDKLRQQSTEPMPDIRSVEDYIRFAKSIAAYIIEQERLESNAYDVAKDLPVPPNLRPATPEDIVPGTVLWFPAAKAKVRKWEIVRSRADPGEYLNDKAFVEVKE